MPDTAPRVSVVIPNYNYEKTLGKCLESVFTQTMRPYEVIVSDDASTDGSCEVAARFPCRVVRAPHNRGVSAARNAGVVASTGDILFFVDSDAALAPDAIENAVRLLEENERYGCVHGIFAPEPLIDDGPVEWYRTLHTYYGRIRGIGPTVTAHFVAAAMPRHVFEEIGPFDENLRDMEDIEYSDRLSEKYEILLTDQVVMYHDEADRLLPLLREQYRRAQLLVPFAAAHRSRPGTLWLNSRTGVMAAAFTMATLPAPLLSRRLAALPLAGLAVFSAADPKLSRFVLKQRGAGFLGYFTAIHFVVNASIVAGAGVGALRSFANRGFGRPSARTDSTRTDPA